MRKGIIICFTIILLIITCMLSYFFYVKSYIRNSNWENNLNCSVHQIYDRNYSLIGNTSIKNLKYLNINEIPDLLIKTAINMEDMSFYNNIGIDIISLLKSTLLFIPSILLSQKPAGGSTITQQLVRQLFLTQNISVIRKIKELFYAVAFTQLYSKDKIIETYFNHSYLGYGAYGIFTISQIIFNKSIDDLIPAEIALLVAFLNKPANQNNIVNIRRKQQYILERMYKYQLITEQEYEDNKKIQFNLSPLIKNKNYITQEVREWLIENFGKSSYENDNYQIITSIDLNMQNMVEKVLKKNIVNLNEEFAWKGPISRGSLSDLNKFNVNKEYEIVLITSTDGAYKNHNYTGTLSDAEKAKYIKAVGQICVGDIIILTKENKKLVNFPNITGHITIMKATGDDAGDILVSVGGVDDSINFDITRNALRHPGSCVKIFSYLAAMEENISPDLIINDSQGSTVGDKFIYDIQPQDNQWIVNNWDNKFMGNMTLYKAFLESRNIPFMYFTLNLITFEKFRKYLLKYNVVKENDNIYVSIILGNLNISPRNFTSKVVQIANGGYYEKNINIIKHIKNNGLAVFNSENSNAKQTEQLFRRDSWLKLLDGLKGCVHDGRSRRLKTLNIDNIYSKTGISGNNKDGNCLVIVTSKKYGPLVIYVGICRNDFSEIGPGVFGSWYSVIIARDIVKELDVLDVPLESIV